MDAVNFLREYNRMCQAFNCKNCPVSDMGSDAEFCDVIAKNNPEEFVMRVEKWSSENRVRTRQTEFLKLFPNVKIRKGIIDICPDVVDKKHHCDNRMNCDDCAKNFWDAEVEE